ncbi:tetratricopeptide repeat protein [Leptolyngbyaceae cyanobacterium CCMR0082]|uniref:Tetratricopeptide repeat protein n=1 Tax=Adonisia turfae CCMR0082 TaxID=2304604 RepID=A0A6M0SAR0_9CYAN|nr:tetratricopeptide repeat protein [Adonisia turfae]NEZ65041.1 tetratricopeptide repeat protein [Adonisia turfae CCMR0082]
MRWLIAVVLGLCLSFTPLSLLPALAGPVGGSQADINGLRHQAFDLTRQGKFDLAEVVWTQLVEALPDEPAVWSNRGNVRVSQNKLQDAIHDYDQAIALDPLQPDPYLNRGAAYEAVGNWQEAIDDYNRLLKLSPDDPAAYNNRGNAKGAQGDWKAALKDYEKSITIQPSFSLGYANYGIALFEVGERAKSVQVLKSLARKYPNYADVRAALTAALWETGNWGEAESQWAAARGLDRRYADLKWVKKVRRWPPSLVAGLDHFLKL